MPRVAPTQQLLAYNTSARVGEALAARIKDPLWFLARQWQSGEFEAENGGRPAVISMKSRDIPIDKIKRGDKIEDAPTAVPLDFLVEREADDGSSPVWKSEALESGFEMSGHRGRLVASEYHGRNLDWYHFDIAEDIEGAAIPTEETRVVPSTLSFPGAPDPRWWRFEEGDAYYDSPRDPEPNVLSTLLPEFSLIDVNNWFVAPLLQQAGTIREIVELTVVDSFGVTTTVEPTTGDGASDWAMFSLTSGAEGRRSKGGGGAFLYVPNIAVDVLDNDGIEEVIFTRDEEANLVWANERLVTDEHGVRTRNGDKRGTEPRPPSPDGNRFRLSSDVPSYWIPYVPRFVAQTGQTYLRRGRTVEAATPAAPQYESRIVKESWRLDEAEIPRTGVRIRRTKRFARGSDGKTYFWVGRDKQTAPKIASPGLQFDFME